MKRSQILLDDIHDQRLREIAHHENKSISEVVRQILDAYFSMIDRQKRERSLRALADLDQIRESTAHYGDYQGNPIEEARDEREKELGDLWEQW